MEIDRNKWKPVDFITDIDGKYEECSKKRESRKDVNWGRWSRKMNLVLRVFIDNNKMNVFMRTRYKYVFMYWVVVSTLLELNHKFNRYVKRKERVYLEKQRKSVKGWAMNREEPPPIDSTYRDIVLEGIK